MWSSIYIEGKKTKVLITEGPYSITRNPLYIFSLIMIFGYSLALKSIVVCVVVLLLYLFIYLPTILNEERVLLNEHSGEFESYKESTPRFFPKLSLPRSSSESITVSRRNIERVLVEVFGFILFFGLIKFLESAKILGYVPFFLSLY